MTAPDMATITESLERSMQNFSLSNRNDDRRRRGGGGDAGAIGRSSTSDGNINITTDEHIPISDRTLELNSHISLPYHWEQCLDLKTGEIYYINWKNGMKVKEDPRRLSSSNAEEYGGGRGGESTFVYSEEDSSYDSEESSSESSPSSSREKEEDVLVVAGCKACFMYFMVPKLVEDCPKCSGQLIHFDRPDIGSP